MFLKRFLGKKFANVRIDGFFPNTDGFYPNAYLFLQRVQNDSEGNNCQTIIFF